MAGPYDFEEQERLAELKGWWEDNRWYVVGAVVAAIVAYAGYEGWKAWNQRKGDEAARLYRPVAEAAKQNDPKKVTEAARPLLEKHPKTFYGTEAALVIAKNAFEAGNLPEAQKQLEWVLNNGVDELRGVARLRLAAVLGEQKKYDEALKVLDANKDPAFIALAADMRGDIMLAQGRLDEARAAYKLAIDKAEPRNPVKQIAQTKLDALGGAQ